MLPAGRSTVAKPESVTSSPFTSRIAAFMSRVPVPSGLVRLPPIVTFGSPTVLRIVPSTAASPPVLNAPPFCSRMPSMSAVVPTVSDSPAWSRVSPAPIVSATWTSAAPPSRVKPPAFRLRLPSTSRAALVGSMATPPAPSTATWKKVVFPPATSVWAAPPSNETVPPVAVSPVVDSPLKSALPAIWSVPAVMPIWPVLVFAKLPVRSTVPPLIVSTPSTFSAGVVVIPPATSSAPAATSSRVPTVTLELTVSASALLFTVNVPKLPPGVSVWGAPPSNVTAVAVVVTSCAAPTKLQFPPTRIVPPLPVSVPPFPLTAPSMSAPAAASTRSPAVRVRAPSTSSRVVAVTVGVALTLLIVRSANAPFWVIVCVPAVPSSTTAAVPLVKVPPPEKSQFPPTKIVPPAPVSVPALPRTDPPTSAPSASRVRLAPSVRSPATASAAVLPVSTVAELTVRLPNASSAETTSVGDPVRSTVEPGAIETSIPLKFRLGSARVSTPSPSRNPPVPETAPVSVLPAPPVSTVSVPLIVVTPLTTSVPAFVSRAPP